MCFVHGPVNTAPPPFRIVFDATFGQKPVAALVNELATQ